MVLPAKRASAQVATNIPDIIGQAARSVLPAELIEAAAIIEGLIDLERAASSRNLPGSPLSVGEPPISQDLDQFYQAALPRLVALIDRSERIDSSIADQAGELLAKLHRTQHVLAEALREVALGPVDGAGPFGRSALFQRVQLDLQISRSRQFEDLADEYRQLFDAAEIRSEHSQSAEWHLKLMREFRDRYAAVSAKTDAPWYFVGVIHGLEASFNFKAHLHNGDFPLTRRTRQVPAGRPLAWLPPTDWESSAIDALHLMGFAEQSDWTLERTLHRLEAYNGFGYRRRGLKTPYLWSFSTHYDRGKFVADGRFDERARSQQCGGAVIIKLLAEAGEISFPEDDRPATAEQAT